MTTIFTYKTLTKYEPLVTIDTAKVNDEDIVVQLKFGEKKICELNQLIRCGTCMMLVLKPTD